MTALGAAHRSAATVPPMAISLHDAQNLPTPDLALAVLRDLGYGTPINLNNYLREHEGGWAAGGVDNIYMPLSRMSEAWSWLEAHSLLAAHPTQTETSNTQHVTNSGYSLASEQSPITRLWAEVRLAGDLDAVLEPAKTMLALGDYETAAFSAMKAVEVEVRAAAGLENRWLGKDLMRKAFGPKPDAPLMDPHAETGEQQATADLFAGAIGVYKNPASHRTVEFEDPVEPAEVIQLANLLLRIVRRAERRLPPPGGWDYDRSA